MRRIALTVALLALTVAAAAQAPAAQREPSSQLSIYFDQTDRPANVSYSKGTHALKAKAQAITMAQLEGRLTVRMRDVTVVVSTATGNETKNYASVVLWFESNGDLTRYSFAD